MEVVDEVGERVDLAGIADPDPDLARACLTRLADLRQERRGHARQLSVAPCVAAAHEQIPRTGGRDIGQPALFEPAGPAALLDEVTDGVTCLPLVARTVEAEER